MLTEQTIIDLFAKGYGIVRSWNGTMYETHHNKAFSQTERKRMPKFEEPMPADDRAAVEARQRAHEAYHSEMLSRALSCADVAKAINRTFGGRLTHRSKSGSVYTTLRSGHTVRVSDHNIGKMDGSGDVMRWDVEIIIGGRYGFQPEQLADVMDTVRAKVEDHE